MLTKQWLSFGSIPLEAVIIWGIQHHADGDEPIRSLQPRHANEPYRKCTEAAWMHLAPIFGLVSIKHRQATLVFTIKDRV